MKRVPRNAVVSWMALMSLVPSDYLPLMQAANPQQQTTAKSRRAKSSGNKATQQASKKAGSADGEEEKCQSYRETEDRDIFRREETAGGYKPRDSSDRTADKGERPLDKEGAK